MTIKEANKYLSNHIDRINSEKDELTVTVSFEWIDIVGEALEKQIPKKPSKTTAFTDGTYYVCPNCKKIFTGIGRIENRDQFCDICGQAIDWSEDNGDN